ncbi:MAG: nuclear transport factor 2 family protein [Rhodobiaceae bacterium]|nr:nuclear transport factor 2 family protein [Rhodobiaceae bacterium]
MNPKADIPQQVAVAHALEDLLLDFFMGLDTFAFDGLANCLAEDGEWHRQGKVLRGRAMVLDAMAERGRDVRTAHVVTNFQVTGTGGATARARFYLVGYRYDGPVTEGVPAPMQPPFSVGLYDCRFAMTGDGWKIASLSGSPRFKR